MTPLITVPVGPKNAYTNSENGLRYYRWQGIDYPSVTSIRRMAGLPFGLHAWTVSKVVERAVNGHADLGKMLGSGTPEQVKAAKSWLRAASTEERDAAASLGTRVHDAVAEGRDLVDVGADLAPFVRHFRHWMDQTNAEILLSERQVWSTTLGYAGTFDLLVRFPDGSVWLIDLKTGKGTYTDHALQCIAYSMADFVGEDDVIDHEATALLKEASGMALLHLRPEGWKFQALHATPEVFTAFRGLLAFAKFSSQNPTIDTLVRAEKTGAAA
jgi:hypothetical protein